METTKPSNNLPRERIVVGVDGSPGARRALSWALAESRLRGCDLDVVSAWEYPYGWSEGYNPRWAEDEDYFRAAAFDAADGAVSDALDGNPRPPWLRVIAAEGPASAVLLDHAVEADLLVVGSRGRGGFAELLLGSVSTACVHHAACPVAVVRDTGAH